jgi:hypothetical protein
MRGQMVRMAAAMLLVFGLSAANAGTQKPAKVQKPVKPKIQTYTGMVKVTKDKAGHVTDVKLSIGKAFPHKYSILLDTEGKALATKMDGKQVQVKGLLQKKSGKTVLLVKQYRLFAPKSTKKAVAAKPATRTARKPTTVTTSKSTTATAPKSTTPPSPR